MSETPPPLRSSSPSPASPPEPPPFSQSPFSPPPLLPIAPVAVLPMDYSMERARPGIVTAIGIVSIVLASLGLIAGLGSGLYAVGFAVIAAASSKMATFAAAGAPSSASVTINAADQTPPAQIAAGPRGLEPPVREAIVAGLARRHAFSDEKKNRLHELLARGGQEIFPGADASASGAAPSIESVAASVTEAAELPRVVQGGSGEGSVYFIVGTGKIELYDDHAVFFPAGRSVAGAGQPIRVAKGVSIDEDDPEAATIGGATSSGSGGPAGGGPAGATGGGNGALTPAQVQAVVNQAQLLSGGRMNASQIATLTKELQDPAQQLISTTVAIAPARQVRSVIIRPDASVQLSTDNAFVLINSSGQVTSSANPAAALSRFRIRPIASILTIVASLAGLGLAIFLLVIGILTLRQWPSTRRLHLVYASLKIPVAALAAIGWFMLLSDFETSISGFAQVGPPGATNPPASSSGAGPLVFAIVLGVVACAYPVALLIAMNAKSVREYYGVRIAGVRIAPG